MTLREPQRGEPVAVASDVGIRATLTHLRRHWIAYCSLTLGFSMLSIVMNTYQLWGVQYFVRVFGFTTTRAGIWLGSLIAIGGTLGILAGGWYYDRLFASGRADAAMRVGLVAACAMLPSSIFSTQMPTPDLALSLMVPIGFFTCFGFGASGAAIVVLTPPRMRAQVAALYLFVINMVAMGLGPTLTAALNDHVFSDDLAVGKSMALVTTGALLAGCVLFVWGAPYIKRMAPGVTVESRP